MNAPARGPGLAADRVRVAAWAGILVVLVGARVVGFTTDSDAYLDVAANLKAGRGLVQTVVDFWRPGVPDPLGLWPPLYPLAVAALSVVGLALETAARLVSGLSFVVFALGFHALALRVGGRPFAFVTALIALLAPALVATGAFAWSEALYLAFATWALVGATDLAEAARAGGGIDPRRALLAGLWLGCAADTRYLGLALVPVVFALLVTARVRGRALAAWAGGVALPVVPWLVHGMLAFGRPLGPTLPARTVRAWEIVHQVISAARWDLLPHPLSVVAGIAGLAFLGIAKAWLWAVRRPGATRTAAWVALVQLVAVGVAAARLGINDANGRYTVVAWPFLVLVTAAGATAALGRIPGDPARARTGQIVAAAVALALCGISIGRALATQPVPPPAQAVRRAEEAALRRLGFGGTGPVLSDRGHLLRLATDRAAVQVPPARFRVREFTAEDERRWVGAGVTTAVFGWNERAGLGDWLRQRTAGGAGAWAIEDSVGGLVRYRVAP